MNLLQMTSAGPYAETIHSKIPPNIQNLLGLLNLRISFNAPLSFLTSSVIGLVYERKAGLP